MSPVGEQIQLKNISKSYVLKKGQKRVFRDLSLSWPSKEFVSFVGPSGCGKSTLLRLLMGLESPDQGEVSLIANPLSMVFQEPRLLPWRTVLENVCLPMELQGSSRKHTDRDRAEEILASLGLERFSAQFPSQLSGGMKMRVSIARALLNSPQLILLDEPFSALDEVTRFRLQEEFRSVFQVQKMGSVFVTHSLSEAVFLSDRVFILKGPEETQEFPISLPTERTSELRSSPAFLKTVEQLSEIFRTIPGAL